MRILNYKDLAISDGRAFVLDVLDKGLEAIDTARVIQRNVILEDGRLSLAGDVFELEDVGKIYVVGVGKCSLEAAAEVEKILGNRIYSGVVIDVQEGTLSRIKTFDGTHPFPSEVNIDATREIIGLLNNAKEKDLVLFLISGGGSVLLCQPQTHTCQQETDLIKALFAAGADIEKINTIRKHLSLARGGNLAKFAYPARSVALIFSDVPGNAIEFIASGPTVKDTTSVEDAQKIMRELCVDELCGFPVQFLETPKEDIYFAKVSNHVVVSNSDALGAMEQYAKSRGVDAKIVTDTFSGEARDAGRRIVEDVSRAQGPALFLYAGETTVKIKKQGKGGRNLELVLAASAIIQGGDVVAAIDSDGRDNTEYAGALCDILTREKAGEKGLESIRYLDENDSFDFFSKTKDYILTGDTGSNVSDIIIAYHNG